MCGIAGLISLDRPLIDAPAVMARMLKRLHHRGPDDHGAHFSEHVALGNTRLSIVGVETGHQPIANETGTVVTVMNGEIYNAMELRQALQQRGHRFKTTTDTEVLVHLYEDHGAAFLPQLEGMFTFAVYDLLKRVIIIGRDRFGMKPLFYMRSPTTVAFASEIKALRELPDFSNKLSPEGLSTYLGLMYVPDPWTIYKDVYSLRPGHYLEVSRDGVSDRKYFDVSFRGTERITLEDATEELTRLIPAAVERHLMSDVPIASLLSGGLDSRTVTAAMWQVGGPSTAFTIGFDERPFDEGAMAASWIKQIGGSHERINLDEASFVAQLTDRYDHLDQPYAVWVNGASGILASRIRDKGFKVVLTGEGGDELFCGYPTLHAANFARYYRHVPRPIRSAVRAGVNRLPAGEGRVPLAFMGQSFVNAVVEDDLRTFFGFKQVLAYHDFGEILTSEALKAIGHVDPAIAFEQYRSVVDGWPLIDALSYVDLKVFLPSCSLVPNDNAFMASSVETRMPLLDYRLVDFVTSLPVSLRFNPLNPKALLKGAMHRYLGRTAPKAVDELRGYKKMGFEIPITDWIAGKHLGARLQADLQSDRVGAGGFFKPGYVDRLMYEQRSKRRNNERKLQVVLALETFLRRTGHTV